MIEHTIGEVILVPSLRCNLQCDHCCRESGPDKRGLMSDRVLDQLREWFLGGPLSGFSTLTVSGGEPFMLPLKFWKRLANIAPSGLEFLTIITNGVWTRNPTLRHNVIADTFPVLSDIAAHVSLEMSDDDYHRWARPCGVEDTWRTLKYEVSEGFQTNRKGSEEGWFFLWGHEQFEFGSRQWDITSPGSIMPIGRGKDAYMGEGDRIMDCGMEITESKYGVSVEHQITVWPNGDISACCNNSSVVGSIFDADLDRTFANQALHYEYMHQRFPAGHDGVTLSACEICRSGLVPLQ